MSQASPRSAVLELADRCGGSWPTLLAAALAAPVERDRLSTLLAVAQLQPPDTGAVVFGSLARNEWTSKSDLDWTLLVDGPVKAEHTEIARRMGPELEGLQRKPGPTGVFGGLTFSHDLVHFIGGDDDSNTNTTRRILLLLESRSLGSDTVRQRVLRALLSRYVDEDLLFHRPAGYFVPRFLLNDYVRYWRTMTVDSAQKRRERVTKWALRNVKLRLSRKLIFTAGFWACLKCKVQPSPELRDAREHDDRDAVSAAMTQLLFEESQRTPLENLASLFLTYNADAAGKQAFDAYEAFVAILDDPKTRKQLEELTVDAAMNDSLFQRAKSLADEFQAGLSHVFFESGDAELTHAAQTYGVF